MGKSKELEATQYADARILVEEIKPLVTEELIEEHRRDPIGFHSNELDRVLTHIRLSRFTQENKGVIVCTKPHEEWCLGRLSGVRGIPPSIDRSQAFSSRDAAEHAVFLRRLKELGLIED